MSTESWGQHVGANAGTHMLRLLLLALAHNKEGCSEIKTLSSDYKAKDGQRVKVYTGAMALWWSVG